MDLNEKSLELVVSEKSLGKLTTNANQIKELVLQILPKYSVENYNESNIDQAKKDKALLNNSAKLLNSKRIELEKEFLKPFDEFKGVISETVKLIGEATAKIDSVVKGSENKAKEEKHAEIEAYWKDTEFTLIPLSKIWDDKWLNKSTSMKSVKADISSSILRIQEDLKTIELINEDVELLKSLYLDTLNLNSTIEYSNKLKENRKKLEEVKQPEPLRFTQPDTITEDALWDDAEHFEVPQKETVQVAQKIESIDQEKLERIMRVVGTKEQLIALGDWMYNNGIHFEKLENVTA